MQGAFLNGLSLINTLKKEYGDAPSFAIEAHAEMCKMASRLAIIIPALAWVCNSERDFTARKCSLQSVFHKIIEHLKKNMGTLWI